MLLAIETSTRSGSVAVGLEDGSVTFESLASGRNEDLAETVATLFPEGGEAITSYALGIGPGSFTGLRVGLCFLKGYATVFPRPVAAISSFRVVAEQVFEAEPSASSVLVVIDARNRELLAGRYLKDQGAVRVDEELPDGLYDLAALEAQLGGWRSGRDLLAGEGATLLGASLERADAGLWVPRADTLARLAAPELRAGKGRTIRGLEPAYLQRPTAERRGAVHSGKD